MKELKIMKSFTKNRSGASGTEFALVLPFLLLMLVGAIELGRLLHDYQVVSKGLRDGARYLARQAWTCPSAGVGVGSINVALHEDIAKHLAMTGVVNPTDISAGTLPANPASGDLLLGYWSNANSITITIDCTAKANAAITGGAFAGAYSTTGDFVPSIHMEADVPFTFIFGFWTLGNLTIDHNEPGIGT
jgi:Flp pilus assembly pilin Flp